MGLIEDVRQRLFQSALQRQVRAIKNKRQQKPMNLEISKSVGILFDANDLQNRNIVLNFSKKLEKSKKKVELLGFLDKAPEDEIIHFPIFTKKEIDWIYRPKGEAVRHFLDTSFDLFLHLHPFSQCYSDYIAALSKAHLRVGPYSSREFAYDLMIDMEGDTDLKKLIQQMESLLAKLNIKNEAA